MEKLLLVLALCTALFTGCTARQDNSQRKDWLAQAKLDAVETPEELYAKALEEGILTVYSTSTRVVDTAKSFQAQYPGLTVKVLDIRADELMEMLRQTITSGEYGCDVVLCADGNGVLSNELLPQGFIYKYVPKDMEDSILEGNNGPLLTFMNEVIMLAYNDAAYESPPVDNWWELTEEQWRGKVLMPNPVRSVTTFGFLAMVTQNDAPMAQAYMDRYGTPLETLPGEGAGKTFVRKLVENGLVVVNSSDEVAEGVGGPANQEPRLGIMVSSKIRLRDVGYQVQIMPDMAPFAGVYAPNNLMIAGGAKNINAAKLFIRWTLGEADGQGEGYRPYLQNGAWSVRKDVESASTVALEDMALLNYDIGYIYKNQKDIHAFWESLLTQ